MISIIFYWMIFKRCGQKGWYSLIPIFNIYALFSMGWENSFFWLYMLSIGCMVGAICSAMPIGVVLTYALGMLLYLIMLLKLMKKMSRGKIWVILTILFDVVFNCIAFAIQFQEMFPAATLNLNL